MGLDDGDFDRYNKCVACGSYVPLPEWWCPACWQNIVLGMDGGKVRSLKLKAEPMEIKWSTNTQTCSQCRCVSILNNFGYCAKCWIKLKPEQIEMLTGNPIQVRVVERIGVRPSFNAKFIGIIIAAVVGASIRLCLFFYFHR